MSEAAIKFIQVTPDELKRLVREAVREELTTKRPANDPDVVYMTPKQVAEILNCSTRSVQRLATAKELPSRRVGRDLRFRRVDVEAYLAQKG